MATEIVRAAWAVGRSALTLGRRALGGDRQAREALVAFRRAADGYAFPTQPVWNGSIVRLVFRPPRHWANISDYEAFVLGALAIEADPTTIFEIGTGDGYSAWILARNTQATVYTLDLPLGQMPSGDCAGDLDAGREAPRGALLTGERRVCQIEGDSLTFDFSPWHRRCGLVFVDGAHSTPYVESDTRNALILVAPQGMIVWHDCDRRHPAVWRCLTALARRLPIRSVPGTRFAVLTLPAKLDPAPAPPPH